MMDTNRIKSTAQDLSKEFPRSPRESLAGYVIVGRTLDKCRATIAGTAGEYHFNCPLDNFFFSFAEISGEEFKDFVATGASDEEVRLSNLPSYSDSCSVHVVVEAPKEVEQFFLSATFFSAKNAKVPGSKGPKGAAGMIEKGRRRSH